MEESRKKRRIALGIPVHELWTEHNFVDGYCNCGERNPNYNWGGYVIPYATGTSGGTTSKVNLDIIEDNQDNR